MKLKKFLKLKLNDTFSYGMTTKLMIWYPAMHLWIRPEKDLYLFNKKTYRKFLNSKIKQIGLKQSEPGYIAVFLEDSRKGA